MLVKYQRSKITMKKNLLEFFGGNDETLSRIIRYKRGAVKQKLFSLSTSYQSCFLYLRNIETLNLGMFKQDGTMGINKV